MSVSLKGFRKIHVEGENFLWKVRRKISPGERHNSLLPIPIMHADGGPIFFAYLPYSRSGYGEYSLQAITPAMIKKCILNAIDNGWQFKVPGPAVTLRRGVLTTDTKYGGDVIYFYHLTRTCADCSNQNIFEFSKTDMAFELYDLDAVAATPCSACGSTLCRSISTHKPEIDKDLLDLWGDYPSLQFSKQGEEMLLSDVYDFHLLLAAIDADQYLPRKTRILLAAICILIHDHVTGIIRTDSGRARITAEAIKALTERNIMVLQAADAMLPHVRAVVFPLIGLS